MNLFTINKVLNLAKTDIHNYIYHDFLVICIQVQDLWHEEANHRWIVKIYPITWKYGKVQYFYNVHNSHECFASERTSSILYFSFLIISSNKNKSYSSSSYRVMYLLLFLYSIGNKNRREILDPRRKSN